MKGNNGNGNTPKRDEWETPQELFNVLNKQYNFTFDCCASFGNKKCNRYTSSFEVMGRYLDKDICWMNPPFSLAWKMFKHFFNVVEYGVAIYRCDNLETKIYQDIIFKNADWIFIPRRRICYEGMKGNGSRFPSALIGVGVNPPKNIDGVVLKI